MGLQESSVEKGAMTAAAGGGGGERGGGKERESGLSVECFSFFSRAEEGTHPTRFAVRAVLCCAVLCCAVRAGVFTGNNTSASLKRSSSMVVSRR